MAHFAEIDENNIVLRVLVVDNQQEHRGQEYLAEEMGLGGTWIKCSYNNNIRKQYPGPGYSYDPTADVFVTPRPYPSWNLDENYDWQPLVAYPNDGQIYSWNEKTLSWDLVQFNG
jgi:hypothetical protein